MEQVYSKISKILAVCLVVAIVFTFVRLKTVEMPKNENLEEMKTELNTMLDEFGNEVDDVEGWAIIGQTVATGAVSIGTGLAYAAIGFLIIMVGVIQTLIFLFSIIFIQVCKSLETSIDPEKWKGILSKILFWIYVVIHIMVVLFDIMFFKSFIVDTIVAIGAIVYILYLYGTGRNEEKRVNAVTNVVDVNNVDISKDTNNE